MPWPPQTHDDVTARLDGDSAWQTVPLQNGWVNYGQGFTPFGFRKAAGIVFLRGIIASGTTTGDTVICTLPAGYRPSARIVHRAVDAGNVSCRMDILPDGSVTLRGASASYTWLYAVFLAEQ